MSRGRRLVIVHAGGNNGFINNGLLIFISGAQSGDYHLDMNHTNFMLWVTTQLIPNLLTPTVVICDNASYHNVPTERSVTTASRKSEMLTLVRKQNATI